MYESFRFRFLKFCSVFALVNWIQFTDQAILRAGLIATRIFANHMAPAAMASCAGPGAFDCILIIAAREPGKGRRVSSQACEFPVAKASAP